MSLKVSAYTVVITNHSPHPLVATRVVGGGVEVNFAPIQPGGTASRTMWFKRDGELTLITTWDGQRRQVEIKSYVASAMGGRTAVTVDENGSFSVHELEP